nr:SMI1/KNR4 family protein [uncultured Sphingomonas sp.]
MITDDDVYRSHGTVPQTSLNAFERQFGICLPESYKSLISRYNWLRLRKDVFAFVEPNGKPNELDISFYGFDTPAYPGSKTIANYQPADETTPDGIIIFGYCGNGDSVFFDYRPDKSCTNPPVGLLYHDDVRETSPGVWERTTISLADDFDGFMSILRDDSDD